jgi:hypothetical protein
MGLTRVGS